MDSRVRQALTELRAGLEELYGDRLDRVILYGSQARDDARPDSDVDVMVVLKPPFDLRKEKQRSSDLFYELSLRHDLVLSRMIRSSDDIDPSRVFYANVLREGVRV